MKKAIVLITALLLVLQLTACAAQQTGQPGDNQHQQSSSDQSAASDGKKDDNQNGNTEKSGNAKGIEIDKANTGIINEDKIPEGYRKDLVPIVAGSEIYGGRVGGNEKIPSYHLTCLSEEETESIVEFYKAVMENAANKKVTEPDTNVCFLEGRIENVNIIITIKKELGRESGGSFDQKYKTSIFIDLQILDDETIEKLKESTDSKG